MSRYDSYDQYETLFDPMNTDRKARRKRKQKAHHTPKKQQNELITELADDEGKLSGTAAWTYQPGRFEEGWLGDSLQPFFFQELITDVLLNVKGGKEASVYACQAHPNTGFDLLAAKVYRPHVHRQFRNDAVYREGRAILNEEGVEAKKTDHRLMRAIGKKTGFGREVSHTSWLMYEYSTLEKMYSIGASVPQPLSAGNNAILMAYIGDETMPAPPLSAVTLESDEVEPLFKDALRNIELLLRHDLIHGDLSAYNILYHEGELVLIDFPQVINPRTNRQARQILERDITRVCEYFDGQGVSRDPKQLTRELWQRYFAIDPKLIAADESRLEIRDEDDED